MFRFIMGAFIALHGLVHLLYFGQSWRVFELKPGMRWPDGSWAFSRLLGDEAARFAASAACVLAALGLLVGGIGLLARQGWWYPAVIGSAAFSIVLYIVFWDGQMEKLPDKGAIGILISLAILAAVLVLLFSCQWRSTDRYIAACGKTHTQA